MAWDEVWEEDGGKNLQELVGMEWVGVLLTVQWEAIKELWAEK